MSETKTGMGWERERIHLGRGRLCGAPSRHARATPFAGIGEESQGRGFPAKRTLSGGKGRPLERERNLGPQVKKSGRNLRLGV